MGRTEASFLVDPTHPRTTSDIEVSVQPIWSTFPAMIKADDVRDTCPTSYLVMPMFAFTLIGGVLNCGTDYGSLC